jgi:hypothetical protein
MAHRVVDDRALALHEAQLEPHRLDGQKQIGEDDGCVHVENFDGLQRHGGGEVRAFADLQDPVPGADFAVLFEVAARLAHEPHRPYVRWSAPASVQKPAGHGSQAHG